MTLSDVIREVGELGCRSPRIQSDIKSFVNRAQRAIAQQRNWTFLHSIQSVTIAANASSANLSARFKELAPEKSPITYTAPTAQFPVPVRVMSRAELEGRQPGVDAYVTNLSGYWSPFFVFLEQNDGGFWTINTPSGYINATNANYAISCFLFPADLSLGTDTNGITTDGELADALIARTKAMAYLSEDTTDPRGAAAMQLYDRHMATAAAQDARRRLAGRRLHW